MRTASLRETEHLAETFVRKLEALPPSGAAVVVGLQGDLGSGKTAFVKGAAKALGVEGEIQSPTFVIEKIYEVQSPRFKKLVHIDAYRLESADELARLGWKETASDPGTLILIEWPENVAELLPDDRIDALFAFVDESSRDIGFAESSRLSMP